MKIIRSIFRHVKVFFWGHCLLTLVGFVQIALLAWLIYTIFNPIELPVSFSTYSFSILCASVAALTGAILGLIVAAIAFITHYYKSGLQADRDKLLREGDWLKSWLTAHRIENKDISDKLESLRARCAGIPFLTEKEMESEDFENFASKTLESIGNLTDEYKARAHTLVENSDGKPETKSAVQEELSHIDGELSAVKELTDHVGVILLSLTRIRAYFTSADIVKQLFELASLMAFILVVALICLVLSGIRLNGVDFISDDLRLYLAVYLLSSIGATILLILRVLGLQSKLTSMVSRT